MSPGPPDPNPPAGRTLAVAMSVLGVLALGLAAAAGLAIVQRMDLPSEIPPPAAMPVAAAPSAPAEAAPLPVQQPPAAAPRAPSFVPRPANVPAVPEDPDRPGTIYDPAVLELVEIGITLRRDGDTAGALQRLREADSIHPKHPRILWELATVYKAMALEKQAEAALTDLVGLGPDFGGEYYELGIQSLRGSTDTGSIGPGAKMRPTFSFGDTLVTPSPDQGDGAERVTVRLAIQSTLGQPIPPTDIGLVIQFYDLVDGQHIDPTRSDPPTQAWPTYPVDWDDAGIEIVEWGYQMPRLTPEEIAAVGQRRYYGYIARLYYRDTLQDVIAEPRTLHAVSATPPAPPSGEPAPMLDDSLFPSN